MACNIAAMNGDLLVTVEDEETFIVQADCFGQLVELFVGGERIVFEDINVVYLPENEVE